MTKKDLNRCPATKQNGEQCKHPKGMGTDHPGWGCCKFHGGSTRAHKTAVRKEQVAARMVAFGTPIDVEPGQALLGEVRRSAGIVSWLEAVIAEFSQIPLEDLRTNARDILQTMGDQGREIGVWVKMYQEERRMLRAAATEALRANIAERHIQLAEEQGRLVAHVIQAVLGDPALGLPAEVRNAARPVIAKHLALVAGDSG